MPRGVRKLLDWAITIAVAVAVVLVFEAEVAKPYRVPSSSMEPTLHCAKPSDWCEASTSDRVIANRLAYRFGSPHRGQIVVFTAPPAASVCGPGLGGTTFVKRLIGLPGETWSERNGYVYVNGKKLNEPYIKPDRRDTRTIKPLKIPPGNYFMMGDNRSSSCDSREWGTVPRGNLIGKVFAVYWPPSRISIR
jgi:signal peptidase I